jgi:hypothetical protein
MSTNKKVIDKVFDRSAFDEESDDSQQTSDKYTRVKIVDFKGRALMLFLSSSC